MIDQKEVNLLVRANFRGKQTLQEVKNSLDDIGTSLDKQTAAAKRGESSIDELKASQQALLNVQKQLEDNARLISTYSNSAKSIEDLRKKLDELNGAYEKQAAVNAKAESVTKTQENALAKLERQRARATASLDRQIQQEAKLSDALRTAGVDINNLAAANSLVEQSAIRVGQGLRTADDAIKSYATDVRMAREEQQRLAREQKQFDAAAKQSADAAADRARTAAEAVESAARRQAALASQRVQQDAGTARNKELEREIARTKELAALRADIEARSAGSARDAGLTKTADEAERAARQYGTLARASSDLTPKVVSLRDAVNSIVTPANASTTNLTALEKNVASLGNTIDKIRGPVKDYDRLFKELTQSQKALASQAGLVDSFRQQSAAVKAARTEFSTARADVLKYTTAMKAGGDAATSFVQPLAQAEQRLRTASAALGNQITQTRATREALRSAGIATNDLANAEQRLLAVTTQTSSATKSLTASVEEYGRAAQRSKSGGGIFGDEGRTTLSFVQRLRGEILALTAAFVGLQGVQSLGTGAIEASKGRESSKNVLGVGLGTTDPKAIDAEYEYVKKQSDRIGLVFADTTKEYGKFATAAAKSGRSRQEIRAIFESFAEGGRVLNLTTADLNGVFLALTQIFSKGKLGAEELRQQLGERLPGVFEVAQQALKKQFPDLNKAMEEGKVGAENLVLVADAYRKMVAEQLPAAQKSLTAQQARLTNEVNEFKLAVADAGWVDAYAEAVKKITEFLKSEEGAKFAQTASAGLTALAKLLVLVLDNFDTVKLAAEAFLIIWGGTRLLGALEKGKAAFVDYFDNIKSGTGKASIDMKSFTGIVTAGLGVIQAAVIGWEIGTYLYNKFKVVRDAGTWLVTGLAEVWAYIKAGWEFLWESFPDIAYNAFVTVINQINTLSRKVGGIFADLAQSAGMDSLADSLRNATQNIVLETRSVDKSMARMREKIKEEVGRIREIREDMIKDNERDTPLKIETPTLATPTPGVDGKGKPKGPTEGEIKKRENAIEAINRALEQLDAKIDRTQTKDLAAQLSAVDTQYAALKRKIDKLGGDDEKRLMAKLGELTAEYKAQILAKFNNDLATEYNSILAKVNAADATAGRKNKRELDDRLEAISTSYKSTYDEIAKYRDTLQKNNRDTADADAAKARLDGTIVELKRLEQIKFATEQLQAREKEVNLQIEARQKLIAAVEAQKAVANIDDEVAADRINQINQQAVPAIQAAVDKTVEWARANASIFANPEQMQAYIDKMNAIGLKAQQVKTEFGLLGTTAINGAVSGINSGLNTIVSSLNQVFAGQQSISDGFKSMGMAFLQFAAQFLQEIAVMILKMMIFNALKNSGNPMLAAIGAAGAGSMGGGGSASVQHDGGVVGSPTGRTRSNISAAMFANAPRYHSGGVPNLSANEYATILKKNEEVLTDDDPRNILNGGGLGGRDENGRPRGLRFVLLDDRTKVAEAMNSSEGDAVVLEVLKRNASGVRSLLQR